MKKKPHYDMLINEFKIGNTLEDQDDKKQQKKKYLRCFHHFYFPLWTTLVICGGVIDPTFYKKIILPFFLSKKL